MIDSPVAEPQELFVETSIFIWRMNRPRVVRKRICQQLNDHRPVTSTYVKAEYIHTVVLAAVTLYRMLVDSGDVTQAAAWWRSRARGGQADLGHWLIEDFLMRADSYDQAMRSLRNLIEIEIMGWFDDVHCRMTDATACIAADARVIWANDVPSLKQAFPPANATDGLRQFLDGKQAEMDQVRMALEVLGGEQSKRVCGAIDRLRQGNHKLGIRLRQQLGDVVIALEAHHCHCPVYTANVKHFEPVCRCLGIQVLAERACD